MAGPVELTGPAMRVLRRRFLIAARYAQFLGGTKNKQIAALAGDTEKGRAFFARSVPPLLLSAGLGRSPPRVR